MTKQQTTGRAIKKVLVANRGEIAVRILRTLREMGLQSVAIYSDADRNALHVQHADEAVHVGPTASRESYLSIEKVLNACKQTGADAVHPGYGFLSENADFARACAGANIVFIGPEPTAMDVMGHKTRAREAMIAAGVPVVPGAHVESVEELTKAAIEVGFPIMLKAAAGGGGKGMRLVETPEDLESAYNRAQSEALNAFGDGRVYLEKAVMQPRHIEIQVLGDTHGNVVHLFERDCSVQRRHQKVVEETPSPSTLATEALVEEMGQVAVRAAQAVNYHSTGTVEFLLAQDGSYYFLEMNTRLQVEHPVTELITGMDLVKQQIRVAQGETLGFEQKDVVRQGHAIECRVYAEDVTQNFMPSPGTITQLCVPEGPGVRNDSGIYGESVVTSAYDPMLSKLCVWAPDRRAACARMARALSEYVVGGVTTNLPFHMALMRHPGFLEGEYDTGFIARNQDSLLTPQEPSKEELISLGVAAAVACATKDRQQAGRSSEQPTGTQISSWRRARALWRH